MSDTEDGFGFQGRQLLNKSKVNPLREKMREFVPRHGDETDLDTLRSTVSRGTDLSEIAIEDRDERL